MKKKLALSSALLASTLVLGASISASADTAVSNAADGPVVYFGEISGDTVGDVINDAVLSQGAEATAEVLPGSPSALPLASTSTSPGSRPSTRPMSSKP